MEGEPTPENIIKLINDLRVNPKDFATKLKTRLDSYSESFYKDTIGNLYKSKEGKDACQEAIEHLVKAQATTKLELLPSLNKSAKDRSNQLDSQGITSSTNEEKSFTLADRLDATGIKWSGKYMEAIAVQATTALDIVTKWLVDDGIRSRVNRNSLLSSNFTVAGIHSAKHSRYIHLTVLILVEKFDKSAKVDVNANLPNLLPLEFKRPDATGMVIERSTTVIGELQKVKYEVSYHLTDGNVDRKTSTLVEKIPKKLLESQGKSKDSEKPASFQEGPKTATAIKTDTKSKSGGKEDAKDLGNQITSSEMQAGKKDLKLGTGLMASSATQPKEKSQDISKGNILDQSKLSTVKERQSEEKFEGGFSLNHLSASIKDLIGSQEEADKKHLQQSTAPQENKLQAPVKTSNKPEELKKPTVSKTNETSEQKGDQKSETNKTVQTKEIPIEENKPKVSLESLKKPADNLSSSKVSEKKTEKEQPKTSEDSKVMAKPSETKEKLDETPEQPNKEEKAQANSTQKSTEKIKSNADTNKEEF